MASRSDKPVRVLLIAPSKDILGGQSVQASRILANLEREPLVEATFLPMNPRLGPFQFLKKIKFVRTINQYRTCTTFFSQFFQAIRI